jgi:hypothetical protein
MVWRNRCCRRGHALMQAAPLGCSVEEIGQKVWHKHAKADRIDETKVMHALAMKACKPACHKRACIALRDCSGGEAVEHVRQGV